MTTPKLISTKVDVNRKDQDVLDGRDLFELTGDTSGLTAEDKRRINAARAARGVPPRFKDV